MNACTWVSTALALGPGGCTSIVTGPVGVSPLSVSVTPGIALLTVLDADVPGNAVDGVFGVLARFFGARLFDERFAPAGDLDEFAAGFAGGAVGEDDRARFEHRREHRGFVVGVDRRRRVP